MQCNTSLNRRDSLIYLDNAATALIKPPCVAQAMAKAMETFGGAGRSFHSPALEASRAILRARKAVAELTSCSSPESISFTSGATESLNLAVSSLIEPGCEVITTLLEHNSVLRPLYKSGCRLKYIDCDDSGELLLDGLQDLVNSDTRWIVCTHGSNVLGTVTDIKFLYSFCRENNLGLILDAAQTIGSIPVYGAMADVICFSGHKGLFGPQGTGAIVCTKDLDFKITKTGGTGYNSFAKLQPSSMPDVFEAGTPNSHGISSLSAAVEYIQDIGIELIHRKLLNLTTEFINGVQGLKNVKIYGNNKGTGLPVVSFNIGDLSSQDSAYLLWKRWEIAARSGIHCAPLLHKRFGTADRGMVRVSFSYFNTPEDITTLVEAVTILSKEN